MTHRLLLGLLLSGTVLALTACSDPTGVGADLGDSPVEDDSVTTRVLAADSIGTIDAPSSTGIEQEPSPIPGQSSDPWRFLFGRVDDPLSGTITAEGYVDFIGTAQRDSAFSAASLDSLDAELRLRPTYVHGDTTSSFDVQLFDLSAEADMNGAEADTTFASEMQAIESYQGVSATDSLLTFELPEGWIAEHQDVFQDSSEFGEDFNGLKLVTSNSDAVVGVDHGSATLRLTTPVDTVDFRSLKSFTHLDRVAPPSVTLNDWTVLQDGVGRNLVIKWDFDRPLFTDTLRNVPLNLASLTVPVDTTELKAQLPPNPDFVRPSVNRYRILATRAPDAPVCARIGLPPFSNEGDRCILPTDTQAAPGAAAVASQAAFSIFEQVLFGTVLFDRFEVDIAPRTGRQQAPGARGLPSTVPVLVRTAERFKPRNRPNATLTYTPL